MQVFLDDRLLYTVKMATNESDTHEKTATNESKTKSSSCRMTDARRVVSEGGVGKFSQGTITAFFYHIQYGVEFPLISNKLNNTNKDTQHINYIQITTMSFPHFYLYLYKYHFQF